jgi:WD40 repeat protein
VSAKLIPNSNQLLAVYQDGFIRSWDLESTAKKELNLGSPCAQLDVHPTKPNIVAVGLEDETTVLVQLDKNSVFARFGEPKKNQVSPRFG